MVVRKNMIGNEGRATLTAAMVQAGMADVSDSAVEYMLGQMFPWVWGERSIMLPLQHITDAYDHGLTPFASDVYNVLYIAHALDNTGVILRGFETYGRSELQPLPEPAPHILALFL